VLKFKRKFRLQRVNVTYHVSYPHKTTGKIMDLCTLNFIFRKREDKRFWSEKLPDVPRFQSSHNFFIYATWIR